MFGQFRGTRAVKETAPAQMMKAPPRPELLAPAGDEESLKAAVAAGADAVYFGLRGGFNARARADNFAVAELPRVFDFLRARGVKGFVTFNTLVFDREAYSPEFFAAMRLQHIAILTYHKYPGGDWPVEEFAAGSVRLAQSCPCTPRRR